MSALPRQKLLPFFLPMSGCPHRCVYCDQWAITGQQQAPDPREVLAALEDFPGGPGAELAYYGGSFTCLPRETQAAYLSLARPPLPEGKLSGVRISTRPDAVDEETCRFLAAQGVTTVELGIQSFSDPVLRAAGRGYGAETAREACLRLRRWGFRLGIQLMTGLPGDTPRQCRDSLRQSLDLVPALLRFYPTLVLENTALARLYRAGAYQPQSLCARPLLPHGQGRLPAGEGQHSGERRVAVPQQRPSLGQTQALPDQAAEGRVIGPRCQGFFQLR